MAVNNLVPAQADADRCQLLELPAELRNHIFGLVITDPGAIWISIGAMQPSLIQTNRQIRAETISLSYQTNTFRLLSYPSRFSLWLDSIAMHLNSITTFRIAVCIHDRSDFTLRFHNGDKTYELSDDASQSTMYRQTGCSKRRNRERALIGGRDQLHRMLNEHDGKRLDKHDIKFLADYLRRC